MMASQSATQAAATAGAGEVLTVASAASASAQAADHLVLRLPTDIRRVAVGANSDGQISIDIVRRSPSDHRLDRFTRWILAAFKGVSAAGFSNIITSFCVSVVQAANRDLPAASAEFQELARSVSQWLVIPSIAVGIGFAGLSLWRSREAMLDEGAETRLLPKWDAVGSVFVKLSQLIERDDTPRDIRSALETTNGMWSTAVASYIELRDARERIPGLADKLRTAGHEQSAVAVEASTKQVDQATETLTGHAKAVLAEMSRLEANLDLVRDGDLELAGISVEELGRSAKAMSESVAATLAAINESYSI